MRHLVACVVVLGLAGSGLAETWTVDDDGPADFNTIQAAIDAASDGDEIVVEPGTYYETISYLGKSLAIRSVAGFASTTIDAQLSNEVVSLSDCTNATLDGFTIKKSGNDCGIYSYQTNLTISNCDIRANAIGGVRANFSDLTIIDCFIRNNTGGGGVKLYFSTVSFVRTTIEANSAYSGGGLHLEGSDASLVDCTLSDNIASNIGGSIHCISGSVAMQNCHGMNSEATQNGGFMFIESGSASIAASSIRSCISLNHGAFCYAQNGVAIDISGTLIGDCEAIQFNQIDGLYLEPSANAFVAGSTFCGMDEDIEGNWLDKGGNTFPDSCPDVVETGACCTNGVCVLVSESDCNSYYGLFYGFESECSEVNCPNQQVTVGACCLTQEVCIIAAESDCTIAAGEYQGDGSTCDSIDCSHLSSGRGACCIGDGECVVTIEEDCILALGTFAGVDTLCNSTNCPGQCLGDVTGDGQVNVADLLTVIANWNNCP